MRREAYTLACQQLRGSDDVPPDHGSARKNFKKAVARPRELQRKIQAHFEMARIPFIVAPYEADHQLIALLHAGKTAHILTEDSDITLLANNVLFKGLTPKAQRPPSLGAL